jgi:uncharacterized membrane protein
VIASATVVAALTVHLVVLNELGTTTLGGLYDPTTRSEASYLAGFGGADDRETIRTCLLVSSAAVLLTVVWACVEQHVVQPALVDAERELEAARGLATLMVPMAPRMMADDAALLSVPGLVGSGGHSDQGHYYSPRSSIDGYHPPQPTTAPAMTPPVATDDGLTSLQLLQMRVERHMRSPKAAGPSGSALQQQQQQQHPLPTTASRTGSENPPQPSPANPLSALML